jgi:DnaK suppressor protein
MKNSAMDRLRAQLESRRAEIQGDLDQMAGELEELGVDQGLEGGTLGNHLADDGSNVMEAERLTTVGGDLRELLGQINGALQRMANGAYGICQRCGKPINEERLEAFPYVTFCIDCQSLLEREQALRSGR